MTKRKLDGDFEWNSGEANVNVTLTSFILSDLQMWKERAEKAERKLRAITDTLESGPAGSPNQPEPPK